MPTEWNFEEVSEEEVELERAYGPCEARYRRRIGSRIVFMTDKGFTSGEVLWVAAPRPAQDGAPALPRRFIVQVEGNRFPSIVYPGEIVRRPY